VTYRVLVEPEVHEARRHLPGHVRQRVRRAITELGKEPRPTTSRALDLRGIAVPNGIEIRRRRLAAWRIVYAIHDAEQWVWILAVRRRPPYDYDDLHELLGRLDE
jgi:mRNA interferase RelE/StbE